MDLCYFDQEGRKVELISPRNPDEQPVFFIKQIAALRNLTSEPYYFELKELAELFEESKPFIKIYTLLPEKQG